MDYTKEYAEWYALLCLIECYDKKLIAMKDGKSESPDWQSESLNLGLEITEATLPEEGEFRYVTNSFFGKGLSGQEVKKQVHERYPKFDNRFRVIQNTACTSTNMNMARHIEQTISTIVRKTEKLNDHYKRFRNNWLYVSCSALLVDSDIPIICNNVKAQTDSFSLRFDRVFIKTGDEIFIINQNAMESHIQIDYEILEKIKREAIKKAEE